MRAQLTIDQMEKVNGGYALDGKNGWYYSIDDKDGTILAENNMHLMCAAAQAKVLGQSGDVITMEEYQKRFGKSFSPNN